MSMTPDISSSRPDSAKAVCFWLFGCAGMVFCMMIIGAITRLTESGLSMVEWRPLIGSLPPLSDVEWSRVFALYQETPEFQKKNSWMEIGEFKTIFFWEWFHRFWGRLIGLAYGVPLLYFWVRGRLPRGSKLKLFGLFLLGGAQGVIGWWMVKSGLVDQPAVSHYRLAVHLSMAFLLYGCLLWMGLSLWPYRKTGPATTPPRALKIHLWIVLSGVIATIIWGAMVAGLDAGLIYNETFPKMGSHWIPDDLQQYDPTWFGMFEAHGGVQFMHRWLAIGTVGLILGFWVHTRRTYELSSAVNALAVMACLQMALGVVTLLSKVALPLAVMHQGGALILVSLVILVLWEGRARGR